jgi:hypothetical protein
MEFSPRAAELMTLLESRMTNFYTNFQVDEIGRVVSVGDGIARVYGLNEIQAGEMVEFASGVKGIALNLENENVGLNVRLVARTPDGSDIPSFPPSASDGAAGDPPSPEEITNNEPQNPEEIIQDLAENLERLFGNEGRSIGNGMTIREFMDDVLWHGDDPDRLLSIWEDFRENGPNSDLWRAADNLQRKYEHADRDEPDTPDPDAPLVEPPPVEADSPPVEADSPPVKGRAEGGPSKKRGRGEDSSGDSDEGDGGDPLVPGESPDPGGFTSSFFDNFDFF